MTMRTGSINRILIGASAALAVALVAALGVGAWRSAHEPKPEAPATESTAAGLAASQSQLDRAVEYETALRQWGVQYPKDLKEWSGLSTEDLLGRTRTPDTLDASVLGRTRTPDTLDASVLGRATGSALPDSKDAKIGPHSKSDLCKDWGDDSWQCRESPDMLAYERSNHWSMGATFIEGPTAKDNGDGTIDVTGTLRWTIWSDARDTLSQEGHWAFAPLQYDVPVSDRLKVGTDGTVVYRKDLKAQPWWADPFFSDWRDQSATSAGAGLTRTRIVLPIGGVAPDVGLNGDADEPVVRNPADRGDPDIDWSLWYDEGLLLPSGGEGRQGL